MKFTASLLLLALGGTQAFAPSMTNNVNSRSTNVVALSAHEDDNNMMAQVGKGIMATMLGASLLLNTATPSSVASAESRVIGEIAGSGLVFKDTLQVESFEDPKIKGVTLYVSNFQRPLTERLQKDFFNDPSSASVGCAKTGPVSVADNIAVGKSGEQVFDEKKSLMFKSLRVQRIYDKEKNTAVYVSFNTRLDKNSDENKSRFQSNLCVVNLDNNDPIVVPTPPPVVGGEGASASQVKP